jgi:hypothetical protein
MAPSLPIGLTKPSLWWSEELGYGWHSAPPMQYNGAYFAHYQELDATPMGEALTKARLELVRKYTLPGLTTDIGIGGGRYVRESQGCGYDVSEEAKAWLQAEEAYLDPYDGGVVSATCWDSLEHIPDPAKLLANVRRWLFVSLPTFESAKQALASKHFKPSEHIWYFSITGFVNWCAEQGFECVEINHAETELGREGITSFAFKRVS